MHTTGKSIRENIKARQLVHQSIATTIVGVSCRRRFLVLGICCMSLFIVSMDTTIINVALPAISDDLDARPAGDGGSAGQLRLRDHRSATRRMAFGANTFAVRPCCRCADGAADSRTAAHRSADRTALLPQRAVLRRPLIAISAFGAFGGFLFMNTLYLQTIRGLSPMEAGLCTVPLGLTVLICSPISGRVVGRYGPRPSLLLAGTMICLGASMLLFVNPDTALVYVLAGYLALGVGQGVVNAPTTNTAVSGMPRSHAGVAAAVATTSSHHHRNGATHHVPDCAPVSRRRVSGCPGRRPRRCRRPLAPDPGTRRREPAALVRRRGRTAAAYRWGYAAS
jgi:Na+/melibiose symporter-like transporter